MEAPANELELVNRQRLLLDKLRMVDSLRPGKWNASQRGGEQLNQPLVQVTIAIEGMNNPYRDGRQKGVRGKFVELLRALQSKTPEGGTTAAQLWTRLRNHRLFSNWRRRMDSSMENVSGGQGR